MTKPITKLEFTADKSKIIDVYTGKEPELRICRGTLNNVFKIPDSVTKIVVCLHERPFANAVKLIYDSKLWLYPIAYNGETYMLYNGTREYLRATFAKRKHFYIRIDILETTGN